MKVYEAVDSDRTAIGMMLARAFANDPLIAWINPDPVSRAAGLPGSFADVFDGDARGSRLTTEGKEAISLWHKPNHDEVGPADPETPASEIAHRAMVLQTALNEHRPKEPFWYLHVAGCDPAAQGRGYGSAVVRAGLELAAGLPAYLETANEQNLPFYQNFGFSVVEEWHVPDGPKVWSMLLRI